MKLLNLPGGATKLLQIAIAAFMSIARGFKPNVITCTSAGIFVAFAIALGLKEEIIKEGSNLSSEDMFRIPPTDTNGKLTKSAYWRIIKGLLGLPNSYSLGIQDTRHFFRKYITPELFSEYKNNADSPEIIIFTVNPTTKLPEWYNAKQLSYYQVVQITEAGAHIPGMVDAVSVKVGDEIKELVDGGQYAHNPEWLALTFWKDILGTLPSKVVSIYPRDKSFYISPNAAWKENFIKNIENVVTTFNIALSRCGQWCAYYFCKAHKISLIQLFCPQVMDATYDTDLEDYKEAKTKTELSIQEQLNNTWLR